MGAQRVLVAGGGVAALEAVLALRAYGGDELAIELVAPEPHFWYRPLSVVEPFGLGEATRYELGPLAAAAGATLTRATLHGVDAAKQTAMTSAGELPYDALLLAIGTVPVPAVEGALTFRGPADTEKLRALLDEIAAGDVRRVAFAVPAGAAWSLPVYELALLTARWLEERRLQGVELFLVTPEHEPLALFGPAGTEAVAALLAERGIAVLTSRRSLDVVDGALRLLPDGAIGVDRVVALPRLTGRRIDGIAQSHDGFFAVDELGRVIGFERVYAAGDVTTFPIKQGGIAAQSAETAAAAIAGLLGLDVAPRPFRPVLRGLLLTGGRPQYLRRELSGVWQPESASLEPLWWPPAKLVGRHLAPFLAAYTGSTEAHEAPPVDGVDVEVDLSGALSDGPTPTPRREADESTVEQAMSAEPHVVAPEDTLGEIAERLRRADTGAALVAHYGRLVGILTSRDLMTALAARAHPSEARAREWMTCDPISVPASAGVGFALALMDEHRIHHIPVVDGERPVGMIGYRQAHRATRGRGIGLGF